jgi:hypothetical protein
MKCVKIHSVEMTFHFFSPFLEEAFVENFLYCLFYTSFPQLVEDVYKVLWDCLFQREQYRLVYPIFSFIGSSEGF